MRWIALVLVLALAGCGDPGSPSTTTTTTDPAGPTFDGQAALDLVHAIVYEDGQLRPRVPGTPGHADTATWLAGHLDLPGWHTRLQEFTGADYQQLTSPTAEPYRHCSEGDAHRVADLRFHNVVADWRPATPGGNGSDLPRLLLGAHWDAKRLAETRHGEDLLVPVPGANDGASGVAVLLVFAQHLSAGDLELPFAVRIVLFDGEDGFEDCHPLAGSLYHARHLADGEVDRMLLLDMVGDPDARFARESNSVQSDPAFVDLLWSHGATHLPDAFTQVQRPVADDHMPFIEQGIPSVDLIDYARSDGRYGFPPYWHTPDDTPDNLSAAMLGAVGQVVWDTLTDPPFVSGWP